MHYAFAIFTDRTDIGGEVAHVSRFRCYIAFELDRRMTLRKRTFPKYWPRSRAGGRKRWYRGWYRANLHSHVLIVKLYHAQNYPSVWRITSNYLSWFTLAPAYRSEREKTRIETDGSLERKGAVWKK